MRTFRQFPLTLAVICGLLVLLVRPALATTERKQFCVFDVAGANGFVYQLLRDYQRGAVSAGTSLVMQPYTDEDLAINHVEALKGKRITVFEGHHDARHMVEFVGAEPVPAKISNFATLFNSGQADMSYAPAAAWEVLEMFRGGGRPGRHYPIPGWSGDDTAGGP